MRKLIISLCLLALPLVYGYGQLNVAGVVGNSGYSVLRASFETPLVIVPGMSVQAKYALFEHEHMSAMSRYALGLNYELPFIDIVKVGVEGGFQPKANAYSNYYYDINGSIELNEILFRMFPTDQLRLGLGYRGTHHTFYNSPDFNITQTDIYAYLYQRTGGFDASINYAKAVSYSADTSLAPAPPPWLDIPNLVSAYYGFLDYSIGANAGYTYQFIRPYAAYNFLKIQNAPDTDNFRVGITAQIAAITVNAAVEWINFTRNTDSRERFLSLSAGVSLL